MIGGSALSNIGKKAGIAGLVVGAFGLGFGNKVAPQVRDAAFEGVMGDPNADVAFTGRKIDTRYLAGMAMGGLPGKVSRLSAPGDAFSFSGGPSVPSVAAGVGIGAAIGAAKGMSGIGNAVAIPSAKGLARTASRGMFGAIAGGAIGALSIAGLAGLQTRSLMRNNEQFYDQSPYAPRNSTRGLIHSTGAVGDIVLGMHNSRGGY